MATLRDWFGDGSVLILDVPLACCALESQAAAAGLPCVDVPDVDRSHNVLDTLAIDWSLWMYCGVRIELSPTDALAWEVAHVPATTSLADLVHQRESRRPHGPT